MQYLNSLFAEDYGSSTYGSSTYVGSSSSSTSSSSSGSSSTSSTGTTATNGAASSGSSSGGTLTNTGFDILLIVSIAVFIMLLALLVRIWKKPKNATVSPKK